MKDEIQLEQLRSVFSVIIGTPLPRILNILHATKCGVGWICGADLNGGNLCICGSVIEVGLRLGLGLRIYGTNCGRR